MNHKEAEAMLIIEKALEVSGSPVVLSSFGKDSLVMLSLLKRVSGKIPDVVFWMDGQPMHKYLHAFQTAAAMNVNLFTYPPSGSDYIQTDGHFDVINWYYIDGQAWIWMTIGARQYKDGEQQYLCAVKDLLWLPKIDRYSFPWDVIFLGMKSTDDIHVTKQHEIKNAAVPFGEKFLIYPLHNWTDDDVWDYVNRHNLPVQEGRYRNNPSGRSGTAENDRDNPDVAPACYACLDYNNEGQEVFCPRVGAAILFCGKGRLAAMETNAMLMGKMRPIIGG